MSQVVVGVGDCRISREKEAVLITYALGSCIALLAHDRAAGVGGLLHFMLPESTISPDKAISSPFMFADTGVELLLRGLGELGARRQRMRVVLAGGAQVMDEKGIFNIGKRNYLAAKKLLWKAGLMPEAEEVGGSTSRTVRLEVGSGRVWLRGAGEAEREMLGHERARKGTSEWPST